MIGREFRPETDREAVFRLLREVGWLSVRDQALAERWAEGCHVLVAPTDGEPDAVASAAPGTIRHLASDLPLWGVTGVVVGRASRRRGLAGELTAQLLRDGAEQGQAVAALGIFDQGFYDKLGFGTGAADPRLTFDPACLKVARSPRSPVRLAPDDWEAAHDNRLNRLRGHGGLTLHPAGETRDTMQGGPDGQGFGLGYRDGPDGALSHHVWFGECAAERGPYEVRWLAYHSYDELIELLALIRLLGDQVLAVRLREPPGIQLQALLDRPFRNRARTAGSDFAWSFDSLAWWQARMLDVPVCVAATHLPWGEARFNLELTDPVSEQLPADGWHGVGGRYVVTLGPTSVAERGEDSSLPTLSATVGAFTRLWLGVGPATGLTVTDALSGPPELLGVLAEVLRLPAPRPDWDF